MNERFGWNGTSVPTFVFTCDPGKASGIITGWYDEDTAFQLEAAHERFGQSPNHAARLVGEDLQDWFVDLDKRHIGPHKRRVIAEGFTTHSGRRTPGHIDGNWSIRPLGSMAYVLGLHPDVVYTEREPGVPKSIPNDLLRAAGYWVKSKDDDTRSAMKHTLAQLTDEFHLPTIAALRAGQEKLDR